MGKFTTRIELRDATPKDYEQLDKGMQLLGFTKILKSDDGSHYSLPTGEFFKDVNAPIKEVYNEAEKAANNTGKKNWIITCETINRMWKLPEIFLD